MALNLDICFLVLGSITVTCIPLSTSYQEAHDVDIYPITSDFNIDHLVKVASAGFFLLIRMYLVGMYFEMYDHEGSCELTN